MLVESTDMHLSSTASLVIHNSSSSRCHALPHHLLSSKATRTFSFRCQCDTWLSCTSCLPFAWLIIANPAGTAVHWRSIVNTYEASIPLYVGAVLKQKLWQVNGVAPFICEARSSLFTCFSLTVTPGDTKPSQVCLTAHVPVDYIGSFLIWMTV